MAKIKKITTEEIDLLYKKFIDLFRKDTGIMDTNVAKMMTRKEAGNFPSIGSKMTNPTNLSQYSVPNISPERRYFKLKEYEKDLLNELIKARKYMEDNGVQLSSTQKANFQYNMDLLESVQKANAMSEAKLLKENRNLNKVLQTEQEAVAPSLSSEMKAMDDELASVKSKADELKKMADELVDLSAPKDQILDIALKGIRTERDGTYRAIARQILLRDPRLKLPEKIRKSLDNYEDLQPRSRVAEYDPIEVMKKYYGENMQYLDEWMDDNPFPNWANAIEAADDALVKVNKGFKPLDNVPGTTDLNVIEGKFFDATGKMNEKGAGIVEEGLKGLEKTSDIEKAVANVEQNFAQGDLKYNADVLADEIAIQRGLIKEGQDITDLDQKEGMALYDEAYRWLSDQFMKARRAKKDYEAKPKKDNVQGLYASSKEFDDDLYSIGQNLIKNDPAFNLEIAEQYLKPGAKTYAPFPDEKPGKLLTIDQRQKVLDRIRDVLKHDEYQQQFGGDFDFSEITDEIFVIPRNTKPK